MADIRLLRSARTTIGGDMTLGHPADDLQNRLPVWVAMTDFYLDTELADEAISMIARVCAVSPYSIEELERIMFCEVWPAFVPNLMCVAGEWAGWPDDYVRERVLECYKPRRYRSWRWNPFKRLFCERWPEIVAQVREARTRAEAGAT